MKVGIVGCSGRMGKAIARGIIQLPKCSIAGGTLKPGDAETGKDIGVMAGEEPIRVKSGGTIDALCKKSTVIIDFSSPDVTLKSLAVAVNYPLAYVIGTTGFTEAQKKQIKTYAKKIPIIWSANMSIGVNVLLGLAEQVASILDEQYDIEITEAHHRHKVDAPSGTALALGDAVAKGRNVSLDKVAVKSRDGITGARRKGSIGFSVIRAGDIIGDHTVLFAAEGERVELTHKASDRAVFAKGAIRAALWAKEKKVAPGLYSMKDVLWGN
jgi:4-hydroxy-tetrahydrodipicolinate reductase